MIKEDVILTSEEFKAIYNAKTYLWYEIQRLEGTLSDSMLEELNRVRKLLEKGTARAREELDDEHDRRRRHFEEVGRENKFLSSIWSIYEVDVIYRIHDYPKACILHYEGREYDITHTRTWLCLWKVCNMAIQESSDDNHVFIEAFSVHNDGEILELHTGS